MDSTQIFTNSRYSYKLLKIDGQVYRVPVGAMISRTDFSDNITLRLKKGDRLDTLSYQLYGTTDFYWVLAEFNQIKYFADIDALETLIAPSRETLFNVILPNLKSF